MSKYNEGIVENGENTSYQYFLLLLSCFIKTFHRDLKIQLFVKGFL